MHSFEVHSNESACRKKVRLGLEQVSCPSDMPDGNGLVEADFPRGKKDGSHVVIPCLYHLANLTKLINIGLGLGLVNLSS